MKPRIRYKRGCDYCGKHYEGSGRKYCSLKCKYAANSRDAMGSKNPIQKL